MSVSVAFVAALTACDRAPVAPAPVAPTPEKARAPEAAPAAAGETAPPAPVGAKSDSPAGIATAPASDSSATGPGVALAGLGSADLSVRSPKVAAFLDKYFKDACSADENLSYDSTCQYYGPYSEDDPSPWPEMIVAIRNDEIASAVLLADAPETLGKGWACEATEGFEDIHLCYPQKVGADQRKRWSKEWADFFKVAD